MRKVIRGLMPTVLLLALGVATVWAVWDWENSLQHFAGAMMLSLAFASLFFLPAFVVYLFHERSLKSAWTKAIKLWAHIFCEFLGQV